MYFLDADSSFGLILFSIGVRKTTGDVVIEEVLLHRAGNDEIRVMVWTVQLMRHGY
jgi:hypothetical protein